MLRTVQLPRCDARRSSPRRGVGARTGGSARGRRRRLSLAASSAKRMRILLVDDDAKLARALAKGLRGHAYAVDVAADADAALTRAAVYDYDLVLLDVMLPGRDGFVVCAALRERGVPAPVLMLTARDAVDDRIRGLDAGADDYLPKPFDFGELLARIRALLRRGPVDRAPQLRVGELVIDPATRAVEL